jgi:hypothetical protein
LRFLAVKEQEDLILRSGLLAASRRMEKRTVLPSFETPLRGSSG